MIERTYRPEGFVEPAVLQFVQRHVPSLLAWEVILFFASNPEMVIDTPTLSFALRRRQNEIQAEVDDLCRDSILSCTDGAIAFTPNDGLSEQISKFADACHDSDQRLALVTYVLQRTKH
ncbi:MAG: hypothetical protein AB2L09_11355 [Coriobacteriia bacterium]